MYLVDVTSSRFLAHDGQVSDFREPNHRPRWELTKHGKARLFSAGGAEFTFADQLVRVEIERLLALRELDAVRVECGGGVESWVGPADARRLWLEVQSDLEDVEGWRPPRGAPGSRPYRAELWRAQDGRHAFVFINE
jgi:hypothetical protein